MIAIEVEPEYRSVARSLSRWVLKESTIPRSPMGARSRIFLAGDALVVVLPA
jgi:hypothetical protein